jgi:hypothetical protein
MKGKGLGLVPLVFSCFVKRIEALHENLEFHSNQMLNNLPKTYIQVIWYQQGHWKATPLLDFGSTHIIETWALRYW